MNDENINLPLNTNEFSDEAKKQAAPASTESPYFVCESDTSKACSEESAENREEAPCQCEPQSLTNAEEAANSFSEDSAYSQEATSAAPCTPSCNAPYIAPEDRPPYTPSSPYPYSQPPKKKSKGARIMLTCFWVLLGIFTTAIVGTVGYCIGAKSDLFMTPQKHDFTFGDFFEPTKPQDSTQATQAFEAAPEDNSYLFGNGEIVLNSYPTEEDSSKYNTRSAFEKVSPSTVGIVIYSKNDKTSVAGQGTGIIINTDGYIATNSHVIGDSTSRYITEVVLNDGNTYEAKVVGYDTRTDLAVIKITAQGLVAAEFANSDLVCVGEDVIAVGNPGGIEFQNTLTRGIISAKDRTLGLSTQVKYIQTDAAINPGNSGGPLCNIYGQVIGINSAKIASEDYEGMGFAIPSKTVKEVVDDLISQGYVSGRVRIGITGTAISSTQAKYNNVPRGILISQVSEGGPCDNGQVLKGDIVVSLDDCEIVSFNDIYTALTNYSSGDKATLKLYRPSTEEYYETEIILQSDMGSTAE